MSIQNQDQITDINNSTNNHKKINIHNLLSRIKDNEKKKRNENVVFLGLVCGVLVVTGVIASF